MSFQILTRAVLATALLALPVASFAADILIEDPYVRVSRPNAPTGAAFMILRNAGATDDRLISATSDVAARVELHSHIDQGDGVMKMVEIEEGIVLPAGATHVMERGGDHVMFMGLSQPLEKGGEISVTLTFEKAGDITVTIPVDNERAPAHGHGAHSATN